MNTVAISHFSPEPTPFCLIVNLCCQLDKHFLHSNMALHHLLIVFLSSYAQQLSATLKTSMKLLKSIKKGLQIRRYNFCRHLLFEGYVKQQIIGNHACSAIYQEYKVSTQWDSFCHYLILLYFRKQLWRVTAAVLISFCVIFSCCRVGWRRAGKHRGAFKLESHSQIVKYQHLGVLGHQVGMHLIDGCPDPPT